MSVEILITMSASIALDDDTWQQVKAEAAEYGIKPSKLLEDYGSIWFDEFQGCADVDIDVLDEEDE